MTYREPIAVRCSDNWNKPELEVGKRYELSDVDESPFDTEYMLEDFPGVWYKAIYFDMRIYDVGSEVRPCEYYKPDDHLLFKNKKGQ